MIRFLVALTVGAMLAGPLDAEPDAQIAIIIDDLGYTLSQGRRVAALPAPVAVAILPDTPRAAAIARLAHKANKEVLLHMPMQSIGQTNAQPGTLSIDTSKETLVALVRRQVNALPHVDGLNNHQGSLLTRHPGHMRWLMEYLAETSLYFVDSYTTHHSVAISEAHALGIPAVRRHVFLDTNPDPAAIEAEFERAIALAQQQGYALIIGHPYPATLELLERRLGDLPHAGIDIVAPSQLTQVSSTALASAVVAAP